MITKEQIIAIAEQKLSGTDHFLVEVNVQPGNHITVFMDADSTVSVDDCNAMSRHIESCLDRDLEDFELTVSSAGLDRPLTMLRQYRKNIGKDLTVKPADGQPVIGVLVAVTPDGIELEHPVKNPKKEIKKENTKLRFEEIKSARIIIKFGK